MLKPALAMDPLTHLMTGACLARAGCNRKAAYATLAMTIAAEAPDLDMLWSVRGPVANFQHHRGITHTLLGIPFEALILVGGVWLVHRWRVRRLNASSTLSNAGSIEPMATDRPAPRPLTHAPVRWLPLYAFTLLALLSHILLDWTNNYGVRPFFPFNPRWYAGSIVFLFEPILFAVLLLALVAPSLFGLIGSEVGARRQPFRGRGWAIFALLFIVALWGWRGLEHNAAIRLASEAQYRYGKDPAAPPEVLRVFASPYPINPFRWYLVVETPGFYQLATANLLQQGGVPRLETDAAQDIFYKPPTTVATLLAKRTWLGQVYLDWSSWPLVTDIGPAASLPDGSDPPITAPPGLTEVTFHDLRFMYDAAFLSSRAKPPISGAVFVDLAAPDAGRVAAMQMNGALQK